MLTSLVIPKSSSLVLKPDLRSAKRERLPATLPAAVFPGAVSCLNVDILMLCVRGGVSFACLLLGIAMVRHLAAHACNSCPHSCMTMAMALQHSRGNTSNPSTTFLLGRVL